MNSNIRKIRGFRNFLLKQIENLTVEQLNHVPSGFRNNIIWNLSHLMAAQQNLCYVRSELPIVIPDKYFTPYLSGTQPAEFVNASDVETIKDLFIHTLDRFQSDIDKNIFTTYTPSSVIPAVFGFEVDSIETAVEYLLYHDGHHAGVIAMLRHLV